ncbi:bifunctional cystathionine gamma-lyase/homocysteine desulfhydrase [Sporosarcina aquimarina]|uniref:bifunctional cystathionine gamma-lyase/homocysteine desulfhydrase n=1 Tax=Sporosarcina aquimarina TaxID=114975 RepID=UPI001C8D3999|nr:bifunctional cystathionine gamma-lyase/homocysteine desulfhydrase [Sporosarcina aquimarina]MBY0222871.1 bifunctional cystathionine gamma-lyase/homocysteine desulfhydrase [Sporosarcina aquimarina]
MRLKTKLIHAGISGDPLTGAVTVPIYQVSTFKQDAPDKNRGYDYSRAGNPTRNAVEQYIADIEGGKRGLAFASGLAALSSVLMTFNAGDHFIISNDVYGGTYRVLNQVLNRLNLTSTFVDPTVIENISEAIQPNTKAIVIETPGNPFLKVVDIAALSKVAKEHDLTLIVDNTFLTPYWQNPLELGADVVFHSATKYLSGHSDVVAGLVAVKDEQLGEDIHLVQKAVGAILGPQDSYLLLRGMKTLGIRMEEHEVNTKRIAEWLTEQPQVKKVYYSGLESHPGHQLAKQQARGFGGVLSFEVDSEELAEQIIEKVKIFQLAVSLGAVESLISVPAKMTHATIPTEEQTKLGITPKLVRLSVGIEDVEDLLEDLQQAFE